MKVFTSTVEYMRRYCAGTWILIGILKGKGVFVREAISDGVIYVTQPGGGDPLIR